jgi:hypothetical protein
MFIPLKSQRLILSGVLLTLVVLTVGSCGSDDPGAMWVDLGKFAFYKCDDLAQRWKELVARENDLRGLIDKANETSTGAVVGSDYEGILSEGNYQSDHHPMKP